MKLPELKPLPTQEDIDRLERENAELKAQAEQLQKLLYVLITDIEWHHTKTAFVPIALAVKAANFKDAAKATPAQCLSEVKAQAVEDFVLNLKSMAYMKRELIEEASQLRQQANPFDKINKSRDEASSALQNWISEAGD
ncbi:hypothetical protein ORI99_00215 [Alishewanella sp. SMS9]|nr:hypothetical protein [Alishewanella sp. SMS9]